MDSSKKNKLTHKLWKMVIICIVLSILYPNVNAEDSTTQIMNGEKVLIGLFFASLPNNFILDLREFPDEQRAKKIECSLINKKSRSIIVVDYNEGEISKEVWIRAAIEECMQVGWFKVTNMDFIWQKYGFVGDIKKINYTYDIQKLEKLKGIWSSRKNIGIIPNCRKFGEFTVLSIGGYDSNTYMNFYKKNGIMNILVGDDLYSTHYRLSRIWQGEGELVKFCAQVDRKESIEICGNLKYIDDMTIFIEIDDHREPAYFKGTMYKQKKIDYNPDLCF